MASPLPPRRDLPAAVTFYRQVGRTSVNHRQVAAPKDVTNPNLSVPVTARRSLTLRLVRDRRAIPSVTQTLTYDIQSQTHKVLFKRWPNRREIHLFPTYPADNPRHLVVLSVEYANEGRMIRVSKEMQVQVQVCK